MTSRGVLVAVLACASLLLPASSRAFDETAGKERIGVRVGGLATTDGLDDAYGGGWDLTLFFTEKISRHVLVDFQLGALYLGDLKLQDLDDQLTNQYGIQGAMRVLYLSVGPMIGRSIADGYSMNMSGAVGIYSVSMVFDNALTPFDLSDQKLGFNGSVGLARRLGTKWNVEANAALHYFLVEKNDSDLYYAFTDGADAPLILGVTFGLVLDLR